MSKKIQYKFTLYGFEQPSQNPKYRPFAFRYVLKVDLEEAFKRAGINKKVK